MKLQQGQAAPQHCPPRRAEQFKAGTSLRVKLGQGVLSPGIQEVQEKTRQYLWKADKRLLGESSMGPMGRP